MMDIDKFKSINDTYGHLPGGKALIAVSNALKRAVSSYHGFLARWGGDEFVVALRGADDASIKGFRRDLDKALAAIREEHKMPFDITLSIGEVVCTDPDESLSSVIR